MQRFYSERNGHRIVRGRCFGREDFENCADPCLFTHPTRRPQSFEDCQRPMRLNPPDETFNGDEGAEISIRQLLPNSLGVKWSAIKTDVWKSSGHENAELVSDVIRHRFHNAVTNGSIFHALGWDAGYREFGIPRVAPNYVDRTPAKDEKFTCLKNLYSVGVHRNAENSPELVESFTLRLGRTLRWPKSKTWYRLRRGGGG